MRKVTPPSCRRLRASAVGAPNLTVIAVTSTADARYTDETRLVTLTSVQIRELDIPDVYEITPRQFPDDRGVFYEFYRFDRLAEKVGHPLSLRQGNTSVSRRGTVRGIHFAQIPPSQAKYVSCLSGAVLDYVIDIRVGSPTFGRWASIVLDDVDRRSLYIAEGLAHAFVALSEGAVVSYLVNATFDPEREKGIHPLDEQIGLRFPEEAGELLLSPKDTQAPTLAHAQVQGILPTWSEARSLYSRLDEEAGS